MGNFVDCLLDKDAILFSRHLLCITVYRNVGLLNLFRYSDEIN